MLIQIIVQARRMEGAKMCEVVGELAVETSGDFDEAVRLKEGIGDNPRYQKAVAAMGALWSHPIAIETILRAL